MIKSVFMDVIPDIWPMLIIILVIVCSLRITYLLTRKKKFQLHPFAMYLYHTGTQTILWGLFGLFA